MYNRVLELNCPGYIRTIIYRYSMIVAKRNNSNAKMCNSDKEKYLYNTIQSLFSVPYHIVKYLTKPISKYVTVLFLPNYISLPLYPLLTCFCSQYGL